MKKYKAIIFDWDGTAVLSRTAPVDRALPLMIELLLRGTILVIISGTTYENIAGGKLHEYIPVEALQNLYLGLGRGAFDYGFDKTGNLLLLQDMKPGVEALARIHEWAFEIHKYLLVKYGYNTDIVFTRPNYCKIDLLVNVDRGSKLFFQPGELDALNLNLRKHGYEGGIKSLIEESMEIGRKLGLDTRATTDAKYLEAGLTTKGDNVDYFMENIIFKRGIEVKECCFWGDEFTYLGEGIMGSDALMITEKSAGADFFDVSEKPLSLPENVRHVGGGVKGFLRFLNDQNQVYNCRADDCRYHFTG